MGDCPYICEEFITPRGISIEEILGNAEAEATKESGFLSTISEDLKVKFSKSVASITPETISTSLDTTVESTQEILMTEIEKELLEQAPVKMMIDEIGEMIVNETVEETSIAEQDEIVEEQEPEVVTAIEEPAEAYEQELYQEKSASLWNFAVFSWAILLYVLIW